eukprot:Hpha_TRINITY_DN16038_c1_g1::TRINITY_DN16038_c1_g1_i1::g.117378::m.117378
MEQHVDPSEPHDAASEPMPHPPPGEWQHGAPRPPPPPLGEDAQETVPRASGGGGMEGMGDLSGGDASDEEEEEEEGEEESESEEGEGQHDVQAVGLSREQQQDLAEIAEERDERVVIAGTLWKWPVAKAFLLPVLAARTRPCHLVLQSLVLDEIVDDIMQLFYGGEVPKWEGGKCEGGGPFFGLSLIWMKRKGYLQRGWMGVCHMVSTGVLRSLEVSKEFVTPANQHIQVLSEALASPVCRLQRLQLVELGLQDADAYFLASRLSQNTTLDTLDLRRNRLSAESLNTFYQLLAGNYNTTLEQLNLEENYVRCVTDTWEGFNIQEQCKINRTMNELGEYTLKSHHRFPAGPRTRCRMLALAHIWSKKMGTGEQAKALFEDFFGFIDAPMFFNARYAVAQSVRLWMKIQNRNR